MLKVRAALLFSFLAAALQAAPVRALIVTGETDLPYHDWRISTPFLRDLLEKSGRFEVRVIEEPRALNDAALAGYDVLILNYNGPRWGEGPEGAVERFVRSGKGLLAFHGTSYGPFYGQDLKTRTMAGAPWPAYAEMMGVSWKLSHIGHSQRHVFTVKWLDRGHPVSRGQVDFLANDELYHKIDFHSNAHVLAAAYSDPKVGGTGKDEPMAWTVPFGNGRVFHTCLGHDLSALSQPGVAAMLVRGAEWAATSDVSQAAIERPKPVRLLVVTGGHAYPAAFYTLFEGYDDIEWSHATTQDQAFTPNMKDRWDAVVLHDMYEQIGDKGQAALRAFVEAGRGVVSTHHAIVDYTSWPWWYEEVIGGKYFQRAVDGHAQSAYHEDVEIVARPVKGMARHPVLRGVPPIVAHDEAYRGMWHSPKITVLMETDHPENDRAVVYIGPQGKAIYIQLGHSAGTFRDPGYRRLVHNAILWSAGRMN